MSDEQPDDVARNSRRPTTQERMGLAAYLWMEQRLGETMEELDRANAALKGSTAKLVELTIENSKLKQARQGQKDAT